MFDINISLTNLHTYTINQVSEDKVLKFIRTVLSSIYKDVTLITVSFQLKPQNLRTN